MAAQKPASGSTLDSGNALFTSLVAVWGMLEGSGATSADSTGNGHTLTTNGSNVTWSTDSNTDPVLAVSASTANAIPIASPITLLGNASWKTCKPNAHVLRKHPKVPGRAA